MYQLIVDTVEITSPNAFLVNPSTILLFDSRNGQMVSAPFKGTLTVSIIKALQKLSASENAGYYCAFDNDEMVTFDYAYQAAHAGRGLPGRVLEVSTSIDGRSADRMFYFFARDAREEYAMLMESVKEAIDEGFTLYALQKGHDDGDTYAQRLSSLRPAKYAIDFEKEFAALLEGSAWKLVNGNLVPRIEVRNIGDVADHGGFLAIEFEFRVDGEWKTQIEYVDDGQLDVSSDACLFSVREELGLNTAQVNAIHQILGKALEEKKAAAAAETIQMYQLRWTSKDGHEHIGGVIVMVANIEELEDAKSFFHVDLYEQANVGEQEDRIGSGSITATLIVDEALPIQWVA